MTTPASSPPVARSTEEDSYLRYKVVFLNSIFGLAAAFSLGIGIFRVAQTPLLAAIDFVFAGAAVALLAYLRHHRQRVEGIATLALVMAFALFLAIYLLAPHQTNRLSLFFLLSAAAFFLKGLRTGLAWLGLIVAAIVGVHLAAPTGTSFTAFDIFTTCVYLVALFAIFWNYESFKVEQLVREREQALQQIVDERWRLAVEGAGDAIWDWDIAARRFHHSRSYGAMLGYDGDLIDGDPERVRGLLHPDDEPGASAHLREYLGGDETGQYVSEQRMRCSDGSYKWILCRGRIALRDADGRPLRMVGTHVDVTERKRAEEALRESRRALADEHALLQGVLDNAPLAVWLASPDGRLRFVNRGFLDWIGVDEAKALQVASYAELMPASLAQSCLDSDRACLARNGPFLAREQATLGDGVERQFEVTKLPLHDAAGAVQGIIGLAADVTERVAHERQLEHLAHFDTLTGVPNRALLADRLAQALARTRRERGLMAVCYIDLDGFKPINDTLGHDAGDKVLVEVTRRIRDAVRGDDTVARLGGDEFVVLLVGLERAEECGGSLQRLLDRIREPIAVHGETIAVSASIGVALYPEDDQDAETLLRHADQAMYVAKQSGRNRYHLFDPASDQRTRSHHELLQQVRRGLDGDEFELHYQPKIELATRRLVGVEALARWRHPQRGLLPPAEFLRAIEGTELEIEFGEWVIATAFAQLRRWRGAGQNFEVSINISAHHLQSPEFAGRLRQAMPCRRPPTGCHHCLQVEVLETTALEDLGRVGELIRECRGFGIGFALDDFGTGYSSLAYLSKLDVDTLKIDQSFVRDMTTDRGDHAVVQGIVALARAFDMTSVAEGVETAEHFQALLDMGCEVGQGYGIGRPMPAAELADWTPGL